MAQFSYTAKRGLSETLQGSIEAENQDAAVHRLMEQGLFPVRIEPVRASPPAAAQPQAAPSSPARARRRVTSKDILLFTQQLTTLVRAQVDLLSAVGILHDQAEESRFR